MNQPIDLQLQLLKTLSAPATGILIGCSQTAEMTSLFECVECVCTVERPLFNRCYFVHEEERPSRWFSQRAPIDKENSQRQLNTKIRNKLWLVKEGLASKPLQD